MTKHDHDYELDDMAVLGAHGKKRRCTDIIFCIIFSVMLLGFFGVVGYSVYVGDLGKVAMPIDRDGNFCGKQLSRFNSRSKEILGKELKNREL